MSSKRLEVSSLVAAARVSGIKEMAMRAAAVPDVASLAWGLPSFRTPAPVRRAVTQALAQDPDVGKYALPVGLQALRERAAADYQARTGLEADPGKHLLVSAGNMQAVSVLLRTMLNAGDEVILTDPGFASHYQQVLLCGGRAVSWPLDEAQGWRLQPDLLPSLLSERTRVVLLVSPSNPTGSVFREEDLRRVAATLAGRGILLVVDDPYSDFLNEPGERFFNPGGLAELRDQLAYLFSFSKIHAMSGWRVGYMVLPAWLRDEVLKVHDASLICTPRVSQLGAITALADEDDHMQEFRHTIRTRCKRVCERLDGLAHAFRYTRPAGTYYVFPRIVAEHTDAWEFALRLLHEAKVAVTPGSAFGDQGEHHVRMAFCVGDEEIDRAFDRLDAYYR
jgi:aminotransferase